MAAEDGEVEFFVAAGWWGRSIEVGFVVGGLGLGCALAACASFLWHVEGRRVFDEWVGVWVD